jgi:signal transduction histidine kinase/CheY-like chemotaxis protein
MVATTTFIFAPDLPLATGGGSGSFPLVVLGVIAASLIWRLWQVRQNALAAEDDYAHRLAEEREKLTAAQHEKETLARENKAKSEMLATLSRDIRSHLNGIMGSADLLIDHTLKPRQREHLATLRASAESLHQSLNDVIDYSSIETGQIQIAHAAFELRSPLTDVVETVSPLALLKGLELVLVVAPDVPQHVAGDATRLRQVLLNLMSNAVKFTVQGRVVLRVSLSAGAADTQANVPGGNWLHFSVSDTGPSIPEDQHATIFDRPSDSLATSPRNFGGAGLELAIVKRLVELMGGKIGARSLPEGGSEFWFVLGLPAEKEKPGASIIRIPDLHVVVLDDLAAARLAASALLTRLGIDHDATDSMTQATEMLHDALEAEATELVLLLDESLAKTAGAKFAALLAADAALCRTRIVLLSRDPESLTNAGVDFPLAAVLRKPLLRPDSLLAALRATPGSEPIPHPTGSRAPFDSAKAAKPDAPHHPLVLVVDDDNISRSVSSQLLALLGCQVELAVNGPTAVERAGAMSFELIFMDCQMPGMDGFEATQKIIATLGAKAPPIVALTANTSARDREKCLSVGMQDFIAKPVHKADLARVLNRWTK